MFGGGFPGFFGGFSGHDDSDEHMSNEQAERKEVDSTAYYKILGVEKNATEQQIRSAYRKACIQGDYKHPDRGGDAKKFSQLNDAYAVLSDPEKRATYDKYGEEGLKEGGGSGGDPFGDIFSMFGGSGGGRRQGGKPEVQKAKGKRIEQQVELEDVFKGLLLKFKHKRQRNCKTCEGKGGSSVKKCTKCKGQGQVVKTVKMGFMIQQSVVPCDDCKGEGEIIDAGSTCADCKGKKVYMEDANIEVSIEPGVPHEHDYVLTGESDEAPGILAGDLHVRVMIKKHKTFSRKGADLFIDKKITLLEALTGFNFEITHLDGKKFTIASPPNEIIAHQDIRCIKGKGMPFWKDQMGHGNLYIKFDVEFPKKGSLKPEQINALQNLLPGPKQKQLKKDDKFEYLDDYSEADLNSNPEGGKGQAADDDDEEHHHGQGQRVQCAQQ